MGSGHRASYLRLELLLHYHCGPMFPCSCGIEVWREGEERVGSVLEHRVEDDGFGLGDD
jgi:hypothetical protein